jgi:hypothetical protein
MLQALALTGFGGILAIAVPSLGSNYKPEIPQSTC